MKKLFGCSLVAAIVVLAAGCQRAENSGSAAPPAPRPTPSAATTPAPALPPGHPPIDMSAQSLPPGATAASDNPQWTVPKDWQPGKPSSMRRGSFVVKGDNGQVAEIAITVFPGDVGGLLMNVNRWRGQIGLEPVAAEKLGSLTTALDVNGAAATVVDFAGDAAPPGKSAPLRVVVVTIPQSGNSWFFKITGDAPLVAAQKETFLQFVKSVKF